MFYRARPELSRKTPLYLQHHGHKLAIPIGDGSVRRKIKPLRIHLDIHRQAIDKGAKPKPTPLVIAQFFSALHRPIYAKRLKVLVQTLSPHLRPGDKVLDVGCGNGTLGAALLVANAEKNLAVHGLEKHRRGGEPIHVVPYTEKKFPFADQAYDVVIVADVLHHEEDPEELLRECIRVSRRLVIIKDHQISGPLAYQRICLIDWAANAPYGVRCLFRYNTPQEWSECLKRLRLRPVLRLDRMNLYPPVVNLLFGRSLQFLAITEIDVS